MEFPYMVYRAGDRIVWDGVGLDFLIVADAEEYEIALADGWSNGKPDESPQPVKRKPGRPPKDASQ